MEVGPHYFLPEWVTGVFYGGKWHDVKEGTFREGIPLDGEDDMVVYLDPFTDEIIFLTERVSGYRVKKPPPPEEPKATVTPLFPDD